MEIGLFSEVTSVKTRENDLNLCRGGLDWMLGNFFSERVAKNWNRLLTEVVESPFFDVSKNPKMWCLGTWFSG